MPAKCPVNREWLGRVAVAAGSRPRRSSASAVGTLIDCAFIASSGSASRSSTCTDAPASASSAASTKPTGPAPTTVTSASCFTSVDTNTVLYANSVRVKLWWFA